MISNTIRLHDIDNVVVAKADLQPGTELPEEGLACRDHVPFGHKIAAASIPSGEPVRKYGQTIGFASKPISPGEHVHIHNLHLKDFLLTSPYLLLFFQPMCMQVQIWDQQKLPFQKIE